MKRRTAAGLFLLCLLCLLSACGKWEEPAETAWSEIQMARAVWTSQGPGDYQTLLYGDEAFSRYAADVYQIRPEDLAGGAVLYAGGVSAREVAVLRLTDAAAAGRAEAALSAYITSRAGDFAGYAPEQFAILEQSGTAGRGLYAALLIGRDRQAAEEAFAACFTAPPPEEDPPEDNQPPVTAEPEPSVLEPEPVPEPVTEPEPEADPEPEPKPDPDPEAEPEPVPAPEPEPKSESGPEQEPEPEPPQEPWSYDQSRLVSAWTSGNRGGLYQEDLEILAVLDQISALTDQTLTAYKRELALHDWMIDWAEYDPGALSSGPIGDPMPHHENPYGFLTGRKGICLGYASTFQLLMVLAGYECVTVQGTSHGGTAEHAWNLVKLENEWYAVDVTWDDPVASFPVPREMAHRYFNVTSDQLRETDHQWDETAFPEAAATALAWAGD